MLSLSIEQVLGGNLKKFLELSTEFGGDVNEHVRGQFTCHPQPLYY